MTDEVVAPFAFLIPISFVRFSEVNEASPNNPMHASESAIRNASPTRFEGRLRSE